MPYTDEKPVVDAKTPETPTNLTATYADTTRPMWLAWLIVLFLLLLLPLLSPLVF